jgi:hypothetical protein
MIEFHLGNLRRCFGAGSAEIGRHRHRR